MTALYIISAVLILIILVLLIKISVRITVNESFTLDLKILFLKFNIIPGKEKKLNPSDFKIKKFRKNRIKEQKQYLKKQKKMLKKASDAEKKKEKESAEEKKPLIDKIKSGIDFTKSFIFPALKRFAKYLTVSVDKFIVTVAGNEPDKTAIIYGYISGVVSNLFEILENSKKINYGEISVNADFFDTKFKADVDVTLGISAINAIRLAVYVLVLYVNIIASNKKSNKIGGKKVSVGEE